MMKATVIHTSETSETSYVKFCAEKSKRALWHQQACRVELPSLLRMLDNPQTLTIHHNLQRPQSIPLHLPLPALAQAGLLT